MQKAANAPIYRCVQERQSLANATIEWVPLHDLPVPDAMSEVGDTPPTSKVLHAVSPIRPPVPEIVPRPATPREEPPGPVPVPGPSVSLNVSEGVLYVHRLLILRLEMAVAPPQSSLAVPQVAPSQVVRGSIHLGLNIPPTPTVVNAPVFPRA